MSESVFVVASTCSVDTSVSAFGAAVVGCEVSTESIAGLSLFATVGVSSFMSESVFVVAFTCSVDTSVSAFGAAVAGCEVSTESIAGLSLFATVGVVLSLSSDDVSSDTGAASWPAGVKTSWPSPASARNPACSKDVSGVTACASSACTLPMTDTVAVTVIKPAVSKNLPDLYNL